MGNDLCQVGTHVEERFSANPADGVWRILLGQAGESTHLPVVM